ncbi:MAG: tRNA (adenosine(37)-N6)-threonylcarbamoyltransferase complex ATPase subunit type 1 TsaE, partial [Bacteroidales bacterium]|nr:tRNA (adenosine(37)-N6)-threonylcarbamoyltransferase complex ATPase subunit type 1 TsaE [Bacteroidales bacterium]
EEAYDFGFEEYLYSGNYCFIEWPEKIASLLPKDIISIKIIILSKLERELEIN